MPWIIEATPERQCIGKRAWRNKRAAKEAFRRIRQLCDTRGQVLYHCPHCGWWHAGHRPPVAPPGAYGHVEPPNYGTLE